MEIKRHIYSRLRAELSEPEILILIGARQVGKSTLLRELEREIGVDGTNTRFFDLEQPDDLRLLSGDSRQLLQALSSKIDVVFIDEFYYLKDAGHLFKAIFDRAARERKGTKIVITGSSAIEIHSHLKESLAGRTISYRIFPLTFAEFSEWRGANEQTFQEFLCFGALPGIVTSTAEDRKQLLLQDYLSRYLLKDIKALVKEENIRAFNNMLYVLASNQGQLVEISSLSREIGLSAPTITRYLELLHQTFIVFSINSYHSNLSND